MLTRAVGDDHPNTVKAAWTYVGARIVHSIFQSTVNKVMVRISDLYLANDEANDTLSRSASSSSWAAPLSWLV